MYDGHHNSENRVHGAIRNTDIRANGEITQISDSTERTVVTTLLRTPLAVGTVARTWRA